MSFSQLNTIAVFTFDSEQELCGGNSLLAVKLRLNHRAFPRVINQGSSVHWTLHEAVTEGLKGPNCTVFGDAAPDTLGSIR